MPFPSPTPPAGGTPPTPPAGGTPPTPPAGGTPPTPPVGGTPPTPPAGGTPPAPPAGGTPPAPSWRDSLSPEIASHPSMQNFADIDGLARSYVNAQTMIGRDKIPMPRTPEEFVSTFRRLGTPETPEGYVLTPPADIPVGFNYTQEAENSFRTMAHDLSLTADQASAMYTKVWDNQLTAFKANSADIDTKVAQTNLALKSAWGDASDLQMDIAKRASSQLFSPETLTDLKPLLENSSSFLIDLAKLGTSLVEDGVLVGGTAPGTQTPRQLGDKMNELMAHPAYLDKAHIEHKKIVDQVYHYRQMLHSS